MIQPIVVRPDPRGGYELVAGERRWRAAQLAGCEEIPALIREVSDREVAIQAIIENLQREDLDPIAEANSIRRLINEFALSHIEVANHLGLTRSAISHLLRLLRLPESIQQGLKEGVIETGHARLLVALPAPKQREMFDKIIKKHLTVRQLEAALRADRRNSDSNKSTSAHDARDSTVRHLEERLSHHLGAPVQIDYSAEGDGHLHVRFFSLDEFDGLLQKIGWVKEEEF